MSSENRPLTPLLARHEMDGRDYSVRSKYVEPHLKNPLWAWCHPYIVSEGAGGLNARGRRMCVALGLAVNSDSELENFAYWRPNKLLDMADWLLQTSEFYGDDPLDVEHLEQMLDEGRSDWQVAPDGKGLIERTLQAERAAVELATQDQDAISDDIHAAWHAAWRRDEPSAVEAYAAAVNAIEGVLAPIVTPKNTKPTLGTIIRDLRAKPEKWDTRFRGVETVEALTAMLDEVWRSQHRHRGGASSPNTLDEARDAVSIAVAVVGLCRRGFLEPLDEITPDEAAADSE